MYSRDLPVPTEWALGKEDFVRFSPKLMTSSSSSFFHIGEQKVIRFLSPFPDPLAFKSDAFLEVWNQSKKIFLYPPVNVILK